MTQGILIYAHNSRVIDYIKLSIISGGLAKRHLQKPATLVTDKTTVEWANQSNLKPYIDSVFDDLILIDKPKLENQRNLYDGNRKETVPFFNKSRSTAYDITPYDQTLVIDSDYLIFSDVLNNFWNDDISISQGVCDLSEPCRIQYHDKFISDTGVKLYWATCLMFNKGQKAKSFFDLVDNVKQNYLRYADIYRYDSRIYRNDISFSVAAHIFNGFIDNSTTVLPEILTTIDKDILYDVDENGGLKFLIASDHYTNYVPASTSGIDIHIMNKQSVVRNFDKLVKLI